VIFIKVKIEPCKSSNVSILTAPLFCQNIVHGNICKQRSILVLSSTYAMWLMLFKSIFMGIELPRFRNQNLSKIKIDPTISSLVSFGKRFSGHRVFNTTVIKFFTSGLKARFYISQTIPVR
jgi:hypothetical protein